MEEPLAYTVEETAYLLGISRTKAYESVRTGQLRTIQLGRRLLVPSAVIEELLGSGSRSRRQPAGKSVEEGINRVEIVGRLTRDGESRSTKKGSVMVPLRVAIRRRHVSDAVFIDLLVFGEEASRAAHLRKGQLVWAFGRLDQREWTDGDGSRRESHQIVASQIEPLEGRRPDHAVPHGRGPFRREA